MIFNFLKREARHTAFAGQVSAGVKGGTHYQQLFLLAIQNHNPLQKYWACAYWSVLIDPNRHAHKDSKTHLRADDNSQELENKENVLIRKFRPILIACENI